MLDTELFRIPQRSIGQDGVKEEVGRLYQALSAAAAHTDASLATAANMLLFHSTIDRRRSEWDKAPLPPLAARVAGLLSLVLWISVIIAGRLFAYAV